MVLEYANNGTLMNYLRINESLGCKEKVDLAKQIANGVSFLHSKNIIHGDLVSKTLIERNILYDPKH